MKYIFCTKTFQPTYNIRKSYTMIAQCPDLGEINYFSLGDNGVYTF